MDGARPGWQTFRYITFPQLRTTTVAVLILLLINAFQSFDEFYNLLASTSRPAGADTRRTPGRRWCTCTTSRWATSRTSVTVSAGAVILALVIAIFTLLQGKLLGFTRKSDT